MMRGRPARRFRSGVAAPFAASGERRMDLPLEREYPAVEV